MAPRTHADGHDRFAERDDDDQAVPLGDVRRMERESALAVEDRDRPHDGGGQRPQRVAPDAVRELGAEDGADGGEVRQEDRAERGRGLDVHEAVDDHDDEHADGEPHAAVLERGLVLRGLDPFDEPVGKLIREHASYQLA
nr:hypothetical protein [Glycomyces buryatensis]